MESKTPEQESSNLSSLSEEDKQLLEEWENQFSDRFTDKDKAFMQVKNAAPIDPPAIHDWNTRNDRRGDRRSGGGRGGGWRGGGRSRGGYGGGDRDGRGHLGYGDSGRKRDYNGHYRDGKRDRNY
eukprot:TRINITY_DN65858_c0_g1_i1.p3 TRINITY_DN65858_c0_g1~~TRINITY_DN65858_c0_g1_i1.p3  ORF type:complete len:125 (-),score=29.41 TRINITY_DN65858_c0_g1_i1:188-562(-)